METLRLVIAFPSPCLAPLEDLFRSIQQQSLLNDFFLLVVPETYQQMESGNTGMTGLSDLVVKHYSSENKTTTTESFLEFQQREVNEYLITQIVLADSFGADLSSAHISRKYEQTKKIVGAISASLAMELDKSAFQIQIRKIHLVLPAAQQGSLPNLFDSLYNDEAEIWRNVVVIPETQMNYGQPLIPVAPNHEYIAHVASAVASVSGLWRINSTFEEEFQQIGQDECVLLRSKARFILAPELPAQIFSKAFRRESPIPISFDQNLFAPLDVRDAITLIDKCILSLRGEHNIEVTNTDEISEILEPRTQVGLRELLKILFFWLTFRFPKLVKSDVVREIQRAEDWAKSKLDAILGGNQSRIGLNVDKGEKETGQSIAIDLVSRQIRPEPSLWVHLRTTALGLIDGSALPLDIEKFRFTGSSKFVITHRALIVRQPRRESQDVSSTGGYDGLIARFLQAIQESLEACSERIQVIEQKIREEQEKSAAEEEIRKQRLLKSWFRRMLSWMRKKILKSVLFLLVVFLLVVLPFLAPIAAIISLIWACAGALIIFVSIVKKIFGYLKKKYLEDTRRNLIRELETVLKHVKNTLLTQEKRLRILLAIGEEWEEIIARLVHEPFGPLQKNPDPRVRNFDLELPLSHQIVEPEIVGLKFDGLVSQARREHFKQGWLTGKYEGIEDVAENTFELQQQGQKFDPDNSPESISGAGQNHRGYLLESIASGHAMRMVEIEARVNAQNYLLNETKSDLGIVGSLFTSTGPIHRRRDGAGLMSMGANEFLSEILEGDASIANQDLVDLDTSLDFKTKRYQGVPMWLVKPSIEEVIQTSWSPNLGNFIFGAISHEISGAIPVAKLRVFSENPKVAVIDLEKALLLWKSPPTVDEFDFVIDDMEAPPVEMPNLPKLEDSELVIKPSRVLFAPTKSGPYKFLVEFDGSPARWSPRATIKFRLRSKGGPLNAIEMVKAALQEVSDATGFSFEYAGTFTEVPSFSDSGRGTIDIAWATRSEFRKIAPDKSDRIVGWGGCAPIVNSSGDLEITTGTVVLNAATDMPTRIGSGLTQYMLLLHELGHVMNLDHVQSTTEVMYPMMDTDDQSSWGPGDRQGLYYLARS